MFLYRCESITGDVVPVEMHTREKGTISIGTRTFINYGTSISARGSVQIGRNCHLGHYTLVMDNTEHGIVDRFELPPTGPVVIEDFVWISSRVIILPGVRIGSGAVIGAGSVVTRNIPSQCIAAGNPARVLRYLADDEALGGPNLVSGEIL
jgi:acetyltransferase-like isoleucine patch superfamily enzyme